MKEQNSKTTKNQPPKTGTKGGRAGGGNFKNDSERLTGAARNNNHDQNHGVRDS